MKTGFKNTEVARQQKERICFLCSFGHVTSHGLREDTSGKLRLVTRKTLLMERKAWKCIARRVSLPECLSGVVSVYPAW